MGVFGIKLNEEAAPVPKLNEEAAPVPNTLFWTGCTDGNESKRDDYIMDDFLTISISNTISKDSVDEEERGSGIRSS